MARFEVSSIEIEHRLCLGDKDIRMLHALAATANIEVPLFAENPDYTIADWQRFLGGIRGATRTALNVASDMASRVKPAPIKPAPVVVEPVVEEAKV